MTKIIRTAIIPFAVFLFGIAVLILIGWHNSVMKNTYKAEKMIELYADMIDQYKIDTGQYPTTAAGLTALMQNVDNVKNWGGEYPSKSRPFPYLIHNLMTPDPWGRPFHYRSPGQHGIYDLYSYGADGLPGGTGENRDVSNWSIKGHEIK